eukprot:gene1518-12644_t
MSEKTLKDLLNSFDISYIYHFLDSEEAILHQQCNKTFKKKLSKNFFWEFLYFRDFNHLSPPNFNGKTIESLYGEKASRWKISRKYKKVHTTENHKKHTHEIEVTNVDKENMKINWIYKSSIFGPNAKKPIEEDHSSKSIKKIEKNVYSIETDISNMNLKITKNYIKVLKGSSVFEDLFIETDKPKLFNFKANYQVYNGLCDQNSFLDDSKTFFSSFVYTIRSNEVFYFFNPKLSRLVEFSNGIWISSVKTEGQYPSNRNYCSISYHNNKLYVFGGEYLNGKSADNNLYILDINEKKWSIFKSLDIEPRKYHFSMIHKNSLFVFGGNYEHDGKIKNFNSILKFDLESNQWTIFNESKGNSPFGDEVDISLKKSPMLKSRFTKFSHILFNDVLLVFGISKEDKQEIYQYNFDMNEWTLNHFKYLPLDDHYSPKKPWSNWNDSNPNFVQDSNSIILKFKGKILLFDGEDHWYIYKLKSQIFHDFLIENPKPSFDSFVIPTKAMNHVVVTSDSISIINETNTVFTFE